MLFLCEQALDMDIAKSILPDEAKEVLVAYLKSDSFDLLADSILPTSVAEEAKNGKPLVENYSFGFQPCSREDEKILECSRIPKDQAERLGAFWATGLSMQGFTADFTAEDGYDVIVSAICSLKDEDEDIEVQRFRFTNRLEILKIKDDRWIVVPSSDMEAIKIEPIL